MKMIVGLTGPTGAGKSAVAERLAEHGFYVIDADRVARTVVEKGSEVLSRLAECFGPDIINPDGSLNRAQLAARAFSSRDNTDKLNAITHPVIAKKIEDEIASANANVVVLDAPQLFESGCDGLCDRVVAVLADADKRLERVVERSGLTPEQVQSRMKIQLEDKFYLENCQHIIYNNSDINSLTAQVDDLACAIRKGCV